MGTPISSEIYWLGWSIILTAAMVIPYAAYRTKKIGGLWQVFLTPLPGDNPFDDEWAHRAYRAHMNAFESIAVFAPAALMIEVTGTGTEFTATVAAAYFIARVIYAPLYYFNIPVLRTAVWFVGLIASLYLVAHVLTSTVGV